MKINYRHIKIESGVPQPPDQTRNINNVIPEMGLGDSFAITQHEFEMTCNAVTEFEFMDRGTDNREFLVDGHHLRMWRIK